MTCSVEGCSSKKLSKGMCKLHYQRSWRTGSPVVSRPCLHKPIEEKFWFYVVKKNDVDCWEWTGFRDKDGYGKIRVGDTNMAAHRVSLILAGEKVDGLLVLHKCNNTACVNPNHLYAGTQIDNMRDRREAGNEPHGDGHSNCKISDIDVAKLRETIGTYKELSKMFGISESQVGNIKRGDQRK